MQHSAHYYPADKDDECEVTGANNPFSPGTQVDSDGELIVQLWRNGQLGMYTSAGLNNNNGHYHQVNIHNIQYSL